MNEEQRKALEKQQMEIIKKAALLKFMTKAARERLNRVRMVKPHIAEQIENAILQAIQVGQIKGEITEAQLIDILNELTQKKKFRILRR
ncbi:MAG: DNA-binding protein [Nanoarchaeota archaeon]|nr:DNA-binding protein [Nanoarchaeota archaeon]